jgi:hypothetical protein
MNTALEQTESVPEISWKASEAIASWRRILDRTTGDKCINFERASVELLRLAQSEPASKQVIVDELAHMAAMSGIDAAEAQAIFARASKAPPDRASKVERRNRSNGHGAEKRSPIEEPPLPRSPEDSNKPTLEEGSPRVLPPLSIDQWLSRDLQPPDFLMGHWLSTTSRALLVGATGLGKTNLAMAMAMYAAECRQFLHWRAHRPCKVLYIDGEMPGRLFKERIEDTAARALSLRYAGRSEREAINCRKQCLARPAQAAIMRLDRALRTKEPKRKRLS